ncbi:MAG: carboxypeptidase-like regulatory domain-containing protein [Planctomycetota bacterium]
MARRNHSLVLTLFAMIAALIGAVLWGGGPAGKPTDDPGANGGPAGDPESTGPEDGDPEWVVTGKLSEGDGPIAGETLVFRPSSLPRSSGQDPWEFLLSRGDRTRQSVITGDDGAFELFFADRPSGELVFERSDRWRFLSDEGVPQGALALRPSQVTTDFGSITVVGTVSLLGVVVDEEGKALADTTLRAAREDRREPSSAPQRTGVDGSFALNGLAPVTQVVRVEADGFLPAELVLDLGARDTEKPLRIELERGLSVSGRVVDDRGVGVADAEVVGRSGQGDARSVPSDRFGFFDLSGLEGEVVLEASADGHREALPYAVEGERTGILLRVDRLASISGTVVSIGGRPVEGSTVTAETIGDESSDRAPPTAVTDSAGRFELLGVAPGTVELKAVGGEHLDVRLPAPLQVRPGQRVEHVRLRAVRAASVSVDVFDLEGHLVGDAEVEVVQIGARGPGRRATGRTDAEGRIRFDGLAPERARLRARHPDFADSRAVEVRLTSGTDRTVVLTLLPTGTLICSIGAPLEEDQVQKLRLTHDGDSLEVDVGEPEVTVDGLAVGVWSIELLEFVDGAWVAVSSAKTAEVVAGESRRLELP